MRLEKMGLSNHFDHVIISEQVGVAKPDLGIFSHAHDTIGRPCKSRVLMVGDNLHSDILGGVNFGFDTCWFNASGSAAHQEIKPSLTVESLGELKQVLVA